MSVISKEWPRVALGEIAVKRRGSVDPQKHPQETFELYSIPAHDAGGPDIVLGAEIGSAKQVLEPDDVIISRIVPHIQRVWVVGPRAGYRQIGSGEWIAYRSDRFHPRYLRHVLLSPAFHSSFMATVAGVGGSLLRARPSAVADIEVPCPPLAEQRRIAAILDKADAIRRKRQQALSECDHLEQALFLRHVGPQAPGYGEWASVSFEDLAEGGKGAMRTGPFGSDLRHSEFVDKGVAVLGIDNAVQNRFAWGERRFITPEKYEKLRRYTVQPNDVIVTIMGTTGRSAVVPEDIPLAITSKHLATITPARSKVEPEFLSNALHRHPYVLAQIKKANKGAIMDGLNLGIIKSLQVPLPPLAIQQHYVANLRRIRACQDKMRIHHGEAEALFASLSQRAFRGDLLPDSIPA